MACHFKRLGDIPTGGAEKVSFPYLQVMAGHAVEHIALDDTNRLWVSSGYQLYNVDIDKQSVRNFGSEWIVSQYLPAKVTRLYDTEDKLFIGTDHGIYEYDDERIRFNHSRKNMASR